MVCEIFIFFQLLTVRQRGALLYFFLLSLFPFVCVGQKKEEASFACSRIATYFSARKKRECAIWAKLGRACIHLVGELYCYYTTDDDFAYSKHEEGSTEKHLCKAPVLLLLSHVSCQPLNVHTWRKVYRTLYLQNFCYVCVCVSLAKFYSFVTVSIFFYKLKSNVNHLVILF